MLRHWRQKSAILKKTNSRSSMAKHGSEPEKLQFAALQYSQALDFSSYMSIINS